MRGEGSRERDPGRVLQGGGGRGENISLSNLYSKRETPPPPRSCQVPTPRSFALKVPLVYAGSPWASPGEGPLWTQAPRQLSHPRFEAGRWGGASVSL